MYFQLSSSNALMHSHTVLTVGSWTLVSNFHLGHHVTEAEICLICKHVGRFNFILLNRDCCGCILPLGYFLAVFVGWCL